jgi:hypothetical protein
MMRKIIANILISPDGVVEEPWSWHIPYFNDEMGAAVDAVLGRTDTDTLLLGRKTYDDHAAAWPEWEAAGGEDAEFVKVLGDARRIVASHERPEPTWPNSGYWPPRSPRRPRRPRPSRASERGARRPGMWPSHKPERVRSGAKGRTLTPRSSQTYRLRNALVQGGKRR